MTFSKSDFLLFLESPLHFWATKHQQITKDDTSVHTLHVLAQGNQVEELAHVSLALSTQAAGQTLQWQPKFSDQQFRCRADAVSSDVASDSHHLFEIKSGSSIKEKNRYDLAYQTLIIEQHLNLISSHIVTLNREYVRRGPLDLLQLFRIHNVTEQVAELKPTIEVLRQQMANIAECEDPSVLAPCAHPDSCPCPQLCFPDLPEYSIYDLVTLNREKRKQLRSQGVIKVEDIPSNYPLSDTQRRQIAAIQTGEPYLDIPAMQLELAQLQYPLCFLDYEAYNAATPLYDGYHPHEQMVFQYSLHILEKPGAELQHIEFVADDSTADPAFRVAKHLQDHMPAQGSVVVWNKQFEGMCNREMGARYSDFSPFFQQLNERLYDLANIFNHGHYIDRRFRGSWSIKKVLPVIVPELSYDDLKINHGEIAMMAWWNTQQKQVDAKEKEQILKDLLKYCERDTFAMVKIFEVLEKMIS